MVQEVGHADIHQIAVTVRNSRVDVIIGGIAGKTITLCQYVNTVQRSVADAHNIYFILDSTVTIAVKVSRKSSSNQKYTKLFHTCQLL